MAGGKSLGMKLVTLNIFYSKSSLPTTILLMVKPPMCTSDGTYIVNGYSCIHSGDLKLVTVIVGWASWLRRKRASVY